MDPPRRSAVAPSLGVRPHSIGPAPPGVATERPANQAPQRAVDHRRGHRLRGRGAGGHGPGHGGHRHRPAGSEQPTGTGHPGRSADHRPRAGPDRRRRPPSRPWWPRCAPRRLPCGSHRRTGVSSTTGLVVESGGIIVTPAPVLSGARSITVVEPDGTRQPATLVGTDRTSGLAVLRIDDDLPAAMFDNGDPLRRKRRHGLRAQARLELPTPLPSSLVYAGAVVSSGQALDLDAQTTDVLGHRGPDPARPRRPRLPAPRPATATWPACWR